MPAGPAARPQREHLARRGQHERQRVIRHFIDAIVRDVANRNAFFPGRIEIDAVHADAVADDQVRPPHRLEHWGGDRRELGDDVVGLAHDFQQRRRRSALANHQAAAQRLEDRGLDILVVKRRVGEQYLNHE
jgi:hypothetical protein